MSALTLEHLRDVALLLDANEVQYYYEGAEVAPYDMETVEFCGFRFTQKKQKDEPFDVAKWAKRMGILYLPEHGQG